MEIFKNFAKKIGFGDAKDNKILGVFYYKVITPFSPMGGDGFSEVSGLSMTVQTEPYLPLGMQDKQYQLPTSVRFENLRMKRPLVASSALSSWCRQAILGGFGKVVPVPMSITLLNPETGSPAAIWTLSNVYPIKYVAPNFNATENQIAFEEMEFMYQSFDRQM
jgi:phage tail-like protein